MISILSPKAFEAFKACLASRGKRRGKLFAKCPPSHTLAAAAWQATMLCVNPYRAGIATMLFMNDEQREIHEEVLAFIESLPRDKVIALEHNREALESLGVW